MLKEGAKIRNSISWVCENMNALILYFEVEKRKSCIVCDAPAGCNSHMFYWSAGVLGAIVMNDFVFPDQVVIQRECQEADQLYFFHQGLKNWKFHVRLRLTLLLGLLGGGPNFKLSVRSFSLCLRKCTSNLRGSGSLFIVWTVYLCCVVGPPGLCTFVISLLSYFNNVR